MDIFGRCFLDTWVLSLNDFQTHAFISDAVYMYFRHFQQMAGVVTAGTGKSYLIGCLAKLLQAAVKIMATTGVAAFNVHGYTLHSLLHLPTRGEFKDLQGESLNDLQKSMNGVEYIIIDEISMVGRKMFGQIDKRLRQAFPQNANYVFGGCSCILFGDFGQLPPVMDHPLFLSGTKTALSDLGRAAYLYFNQAVVLTQVMRQQGQQPEQIKFRNILMRLRTGQITTEDWQHLLTRSAAHVSDLNSFENAIHLYPRVDDAVQYNLFKLRQGNSPIAQIKALHSGPAADKASAEDAGGLQPFVHLAQHARVMLTSNLWVDVGLVNGAILVLYKPSVTRMLDLQPSQQQSWYLLIRILDQQYPLEQ